MGQKTKIITSSNFGQSDQITKIAMFLQIPYLQSLQIKIIPRKFSKRKYSRFSSKIHVFSVLDIPCMNSISLL